jgi:SAM-dependent methyltransferase
MYRRQALEAAGGFDPTLPACEDYDLYLRIARHHPIACHRELVAAYRQHGENMSGDPGRMLAAALRVLRAQARYVRDDAPRRRALAEGVAGWQSFYGELLVPKVIELSRNGEHRRALLSVMTLLRHAPRPTARIIYRNAWRLASHLAGRALRAALPARIRRLGRARTDAPPVGHVDFGHLRRLAPISRQFGFDRGLPIDRYYIERFLGHHAADIRGRVLEIGDDAYTRRFGGDRVTRRDVLHVEEGNPLATFVADLTAADQIPSDLFDCIILTQTLHLIYDIRAAVRTLHRLLQPGGVLLLTVPGISQLSTDRWAGSWHWAFTERSTSRLFAEVFSESRIRTAVHGNVLAAVAFLEGLAASELRRSELDHQDPQYQLLITLRAEKAVTPT